MIHSYILMLLLFLIMLITKLQSHLDFGQNLQVNNLKFYQFDNFLANFSTCFPDHTEGNGVYGFPLSIPVDEMLNFCGQKDLDKYEIYISSNTNNTEKIITFVITSLKNAKNILATIEFIDVQTVLLNDDILYLQTSLNGNNDIFI